MLMIEGVWYGPCGYCHNLVPDLVSSAGVMNSMAGCVMSNLSLNRTGSLSTDPLPADAGRGE